MDNVNFRTHYEHEEALISLRYPVLYRDLIREIRKVFEIESKLKLIVHYESDETKRPLNGPDDFDLLVHFHFNLKQHFTIHLYISIDSSVPNLEDTTRWRVSGKENITREKTKDRFIIEDLDPLKAPRIESVSDPLINSYFIEENSSNESDSDEESIKLLKFIGKGGFGSVYTAIHNGKLVAVKKGEFDADAEEDTSDILNEIEFLSDLRHPNIVKYIACGRDDTNIYIFMEYMEGGSMAQYVKLRGNLTETEVQKYSAQILSGLDYLHKNNIIHRDIKGSNMLLDQLKLNVKLSDFGAARKLATLDRSRTDNLVGTTYWMSPEVIRGCAAGPENDVWAFGITLIEMLTGSPPYKELDPLPAMFKIASTEPNFGNFKINIRISSTLINLFELIFVPQNNRICVSSILIHGWLS